VTIALLVGRRGQRFDPKDFVNLSEFATNRDLQPSNTPGTRFVAKFHPEFNVMGDELLIWEIDRRLGAKVEYECRSFSFGFDGVRQTISGFVTRRTLLSNSEAGSTVIPDSGPALAQNGADSIPALESRESTYTFTTATLPDSPTTLGRLL
jgi:hypothetical protein